ncbi:MAG TPA: FecR domain-containing protein [Myxococcaceae bacterium]|nr:FecR domain-containing protein [Myxococcaceae bacterium]
MLRTIVFAAKNLAQHPLLAPARRGRVTTLAVAMLLLLAFAAIAIDSSNTVVIVNQALEKELGAPSPRPEIGLLVSTDGELRVNGQIASAGMPLRDGGRIDVVRGDAIVRFGDVPVAVLHEGTSVTFDGAGSEATLHHGRAQFDVARQDDASNPFRVHAGSVDVDADDTVLIVERTRTDDRVLVVVREGEGAKVSTPAGQRSLRRGEETTVVRGRIGGVRAVADRVVRNGPPERADSAGLDKLKRRAGRLFERLAPKDR